MPNFCQSCGAKVEEGYKFCLSCGAQIRPEGSTKLDNSVGNASQTNSTGMTSKESPQQPIKQQEYTPTIKSGKSNKKLIISLIAIFAIIIVISIVIFILSGVTTDNRFVGEWAITNGDVAFGSMIFEGNGDWKIGYMGTSIKIGTWSVQGSSFCFEVTDYLEGIYPSQISTQCYQYELSNDKNTLTLTAPGETSMILSRS
jgi:hypothetical protein